MFLFIGKKMKRKQFFFVDTKQQGDRIERKIVANFNKPLFFATVFKQTLLELKTTIIFPVRTQDTLICNCVGKQLNLSTVSFALNCSVP